jgi:adhesin transport system outer membrane protein
MVFDGFATPSEVRRQKNRVNSRAASVFAASEKVALDAAEAYLDVLREQELVELAKENLEIHEKTMDQIKLRSQMGVGRRADESQADGRVALARRNLISEEGNLVDAESHYKRIIGEAPNDLKMPEQIDSSLPGNLDDAIGMAVGNHPVLKSAEADIEAAKAQRETAKSPFYPRVDIELQSAQYSNLNGVAGYNNDYQAMVRMRYNLFKGGKDYARLKETGHLLEQSQEVRNKTYRQVEESMRFSWNALETVTRQMDFLKLHVDSTEKTHVAYRQQFSLGERTLLDMLDTANELYTAKTAYANAVYDHQFATYRVLASMGALNHTLQVKLPEEAIRMDVDQPLF